MIQQYFLFALYIFYLCKASGTFADENRPVRQTEIHAYTKIETTRDLQFVFLCIPPCNDYQEISNVDTHGGEMFQAPHSNEKYVRYTILNPDEGKVQLSYDYLQKQTEYSIQEIDTIFPYDTTSSIYKIYTQDYYELFDSQNKYFKNAAAQLWQQSQDVHDYAFRCYQFVEENF